MLFNSFEFLIFFVSVVFLYFSIKDKWRWALLLAVSYVFYASWSVNYLGLIAVSTVITYLSGILIDKQNSDSELSEIIRRRNKRWIVAGSLIVNLGILFFFKYYNFAASSVNVLLPDAVPTIDTLLPVVGISFYTFQALSYTMDIYYQKTPVQKNLGKYALFVSFFPQLVAGPIEKASNLLPQFDRHNKFDEHRVRSGCLLMAWGVFKKVVVADRLGIFVAEVYANPEAATGIVPIVATLFFALQLYLDFSAYSEIAIGAAKVLGYQLTINFRRPYLAASFSDFWKRWHVSLNAWFFEYLYLPLGGSRISPVRTIVNVVIIFLISGLWHGASWNFVIWGAINSFYLLALDPILFAKNSREKLTLAAKMSRGALIMVFWSISLVFFRAETFADAIAVYSNLSFSGFDQLYEFGLNEAEFLFALGMFLLIYIVELFQESNITVDRLLKAPVAVRWSLYVLLPLSIIYFGAYGLELTDSAFIYFQF